ncbi:MAG: PDDEXK family nuclease [Acidimicrobiales bacterium]
MGRRRQPAESVTGRFAHESELHFAELLDFYGVRWEYEPVEFVLEWTQDGVPAAAFRPDFYLPEHRCFIELTTLNQKLVTKKNAKVRRLRELHPDVEVKLLYQRDYEALLAKYGFSRTTSPAA